FFVLRQVFFQGHEELRQRHFLLEMLGLDALLIQQLLDGLDSLVLFLRWFGRGSRLGRSRRFAGRLGFVCEKRKQSQGREKVENGSHAPLLWTSSPRLW